MANDRRRLHWLFALGAIALEACASKDAPTVGDAAGDDAVSDSVADSVADSEPTSTGAFGERCDESTSCQTDSPLCVATAGETAGFCTTTCAPVDQPCAGGPPGTMAYCVVPQFDAPKWMCGFFCEIDGKKYDCPPTLRRCEEWGTDLGKTGFKMCKP